MSLVVVCNKCGRKLRAKDEHAGRKIRCPACKAVNRLPSRPQRARAADSGICPVCGFDLSIDRDLVRDVKGRRFHRACFEEVRPQTTPKQTDSEVVQLYEALDPEQPEPKPRQPEPQEPRAAPRSKPPPPQPDPRPEEPVGTPPPQAEPRPEEPVEATPPEDDVFLVAEPVRPSELPEARLLWEPLEALPEVQPIEVIPEAEPFAGLPDAQPLAGVADALPPADLPEATVFDPSKRKSNGNPTWLYVLIGFGAAVPLIVVVLLVVQMVTKHGKSPQPVASASQPADGAPHEPKPAQARAVRNPFAKAARATSLPAWRLDPALLEQLGPYEDFDRYQIRLPKGFERSPLPARAPPQNSKDFTWVGPPRNDGTKCVVQILLVMPPPKARRITLEEFFDETASAAKRALHAWQQKRPQSREIDGLQFLSTVWQGKKRFAQTGFPVHGVLYVGRDGATYIHMLSKDAEPHHEQTLRIAEAAFLTFRKTP